jgi:hypothetical protein
LASMGSIPIRGLFFPTIARIIMSSTHSCTFEALCLVADQFVKIADFFHQAQWL